MTRPAEPLACPTEQELSAFLVGKLSTGSLARIERHVEDCSRCQASLDQLDGNDDERLDEFALFHRCLEKIRHDFDPRTWQAFWRVTVDGLSATEAAIELGMRSGSVRVAKSHVLQRL